LKIPEDFDYFKIKSMSIEARTKLVNPACSNYFSGFRISGVSPKRVSVLLIYMGE
jgi:tRNA uridine 5-carboxymethylaminomethyl modification enzyme